MTSKLVQSFSIHRDAGIHMRVDDKDQWGCDACGESIPVGTRMLCSVEDKGDVLAVISPICKSCVKRILEEWDEFD